MLEGQDTRHRGGLDHPCPVTLLLFPGCDLLDVGGPYEVLLTANRILVGGGRDEAFEVRTASLDGAAVDAYGGLRLTPDGPFEPGPGVLLIPGAIDVPDTDEPLLRAIRAGAEHADLVASVCTGSLLLAAADVLDGVSATTHHQDVHSLAELIGRDLVVSGRRWVDAGAVVTAGGLASGIAMALHLVARLVSLDLAHEVARRIEFPWSPEDGDTVLPSGDAAVGSATEAG